MKNVPHIFPRGKLLTSALGPRLPRWENQPRIYGELPEELRFYVESRWEMKQHYARTVVNYSLLRAGLVGMRETPGMVVVNRSGEGIIRLEGKCEG